MQPLNPKQTEQLNKLRWTCRYFPDGKPDILSFGLFQGGLTEAEVKDFLRIRVNKMNVEKEYARYVKASGPNTCAVVTVLGQAVTLHYRWDVSRFIEKALEGTPTYFD